MARAEPAVPPGASRGPGRKNVASPAGTFLACGVPDTDLRPHEIAFCSRVAGWLNALFAAHPEWPFRRTETEQSLALRRKRSDLRVYGDARRLILAGEVKLPGTPEGRTPYHSALVDDAAFKADNAGAEFFFTWNVNLLVLFDRKLWHLPLPERRVQGIRSGVGPRAP